LPSLQMEMSSTQNLEQPGIKIEIRREKKKKKKC
jgi:hypothetical protein